MQLKSNLINTALLGTGKKQLDVAEIPQWLHADIEHIQATEQDEESRFIKIASLALNVYRAGLQPAKTDLPADVCPPETLPYCNNKAQSILNDLLTDKYYTLVWFWCLQCSKKQQVVQPDILPRFFEWGLANRKNALPLFTAVIGKRGHWLANYNPQWQFLQPPPEQFDWETGTLAQRVNHLQGLRTTQPALAIEKIQQVWNEENAAGRAELLEALKINLTESDESFLKSALTDKSKTVKEKALHLLKQIPASAIIKQYCEVLGNSIQLKESKILGLINKTSITITINTGSEEIFKTGIDKLSSDKAVSDNDYILAQLISEVPPSFWLQHFKQDITGVVKLFAGRDELKKFQVVFCNSVLKFGDAEWAKQVLTQFNQSNVQLLKLLPAHERQQFAVGFIRQDLDGVISALTGGEISEWGLPLTQKILNETAQNPHRYTKAFYENISIYLPASILATLSNIQVEEEWRKNTWNNYIPEIEKLINIKETIKTHAF